MITFKAWTDTRTVVATCTACPQRTAAAAPPNPDHLSAVVQELVNTLHAHGCTHPTIYEVQARHAAAPQPTGYATLISYE